MKTYIYMVRHGESPKKGKSDRTRELTEKGKKDAVHVADLLEKEGIEVLVSSPYTRSVLTIQELADRLGQEIHIFEDLKERIFSTMDMRISDAELYPILEKSYSDPNYALRGAESNNDCQNRAIKVLQELLITYQGKRIAIGTHGAVMTLMMGFYDKQFDYNFLLQTSKPDIFRMEFNGQELVEVKRLWQ
ncbi:histidine phosphatase family protein [Bacillus sp. FJAT-49736]|uniref:histidine phosphatase family protein n=1 Tax=Bacillus sp. FJAT-49736 TaxID=2833582 RepID=UPI001BC930C0|nr:histidine phosphatase family protein [Bacillus sp. FJAT-49736]MBS4172696.1 histidine phosphatase family protein [Bacillus sp. FJAT-49736]